GPPDGPDPWRFRYRPDGLRPERDDPEDRRVRSHPDRRRDHGRLHGSRRPRHRGPPRPPPDHVRFRDPHRRWHRARAPHGGRRDRMVADVDAVPLHRELRMQQAPRTVPSTMRISETYVIWGRSRWPAM